MQQCSMTNAFPFDKDNVELEFYTRVSFEIKFSLKLFTVVKTHLSQLVAMHLNIYNFLCVCLYKRVMKSSTSFREKWYPVNVHTHALISLYLKWLIG